MRVTKNIELHNLRNERHFLFGSVCMYLCFSIQKKTSHNFSGRRKRIIRQHPITMRIIIINTIIIGKQIQLAISNNSSLMKA